MQLRFQPLVKQCSSSPTLTLYLASIPLQHFYLFILFSTCIHSITFTAHNAMFWKIKRIGYLGPFLQRSLIFVPMLLYSQQAELSSVHACTGTYVNSCEQPGLPQFWVCVRTWAWRSWACACESRSVTRSLIPVSLSIWRAWSGVSWMTLLSLRFFMHELQLYVSLSQLKATSPLDWKAAKGAITCYF